jgi:hypothetical protein
LSVTFTKDRVEDAPNGNPDERVRLGKEERAGEGTKATTTRPRKAESAPIASAPIRRNT